MFVKIKFNQDHYTGNFKEYDENFGLLNEKTGKVVLFFDDSQYSIDKDEFEIVEHYNVIALKNSISDKIKVEQELRDTIVQLRDNVQREATAANLKDDMIRLLNEKIDLQNNMIKYFENNPKTINATMQSIFGQSVKSIEFK